MHTEKTGWRATAFGALLGAMAVAFTSCSLPQAQADPTRFFVLSASTSPAAGAAGAPTLHLRPVEVASFIRARPIMVRRGENEVEFRDYARWGEPLEQGIGRVLREEFLARGAASAVNSSGARSAVRGADFELSVRVLACEGTATGGVNFHAVWELAPVGENRGAPRHGDFRSDDLRWDGKNEATLAASLSAAVTRLAGEIASALPKK